MRFTGRITRKQFFMLVGALVILMIAFYFSERTTGIHPKDAEKQSYKAVPVTDIVEEPKESKAVTEELKQESNGFKYYQIPQKYINAGGYFPEDVQTYLWSLCEERGLDYYIVVALIEKESGYKQDALGDSGNSYGYTQIQRKWHLERMNEEGVLNLLDPYGNLRVCTNFLVEIYEKYGNSGDNCVLMVYNMGERSAKKLWRNGIYSTDYSREILQRAQDIQQELQDL